MSIFKDHPSKFDLMAVYIGLCIVLLTLFLRAMDRINELEEALINNQTTIQTEENN